MTKKVPIQEIKNPFLKKSLSKTRREDEQTIEKNKPKYRILKEENDYKRYRDQWQE